MDGGESLQALRARAVVARAADLRERPALLRAWADAFTGEDDVTLVVLLPAADEELMSWLDTEATALGLTEGGADVLAVPVADPDAEAGVTRRIPAALTELQAPGATLTAAGLRDAVAALPRLHQPAAAAPAAAAATPASSVAYTPLLWVDPRRGPEPPLPSPAELLATLGDEESQRTALEQALAELPAGEGQRAALAGLDGEAVRRRMLADTDPIPTPMDREGYYATELQYWLSGLADARMLARSAEARGRPLAPGHRVLDLGCASGRALRHLRSEQEGLGLFGVDIGRHHVEWARRHLTPELWISHTTALPSLPFPDASLDVIYALSVFTHIGDFEESLLLELHRVLRPEGFALLTVHPERTWADMRDPEHLVTRNVTGTRHRAEPMGVEPVTPASFGGEQPSDRIVISDPGGAVYDIITFHSADWVERRWGRLFALEQRIERGHGDHQDALVLRPR